ncbi:MAG: hypothetical protein NZM04_01720 [Methylacidiphilales bacterium]|nr:hypothetical protein [Candidatus Methylacidiphilales bacterium]
MPTAFDLSHLSEYTYFCATRAIASNASLNKYVNAAERAPLAKLPPPSIAAVPPAAAVIAVLVKSPNVPPSLMPFTKAPTALPIAPPINPLIKSPPSNLTHRPVQQTMRHTLHHKLPYLHPPNSQQSAKYTLPTRSVPNAKCR